MSVVMSVGQKFLDEARVKYLNAKELIENSKNDPPSEPYKSKYEASEILQGLETDLNNEEVIGDNHRSSVLSCLMKYELGVIAFETEELHNSEKYLQKCWDILKEDALKTDTILLSINVLNQLGILWSGRNELEKARDYLKTAEIIYGEYKLSKKQCPLDLLDLFCDHDENVAKNWSPLEKALTHTLYYLAQVYEHLNENESSAKYCHITLKRQLDSKEYDPLDWSLNCATLSQYFIAKEKFSAARHVLACSSYVITEYEAKLKSEVENKDDERWDHLNRCKADISRCWAKYALHLLIMSRDNRKSDNDLANGVQTLHLEESEDFTKVYRLLKENEVKDLENQITCSLVSNFEDARLIFLFGVERLHESKKYYILNDYTYDYVQIIQDNSKLYKFLAVFEESIDRKCKMHKRRIDLLEEILKKLNPQFYLTLCRQLMFELAETYSEMMDLKIKVANTEDENISTHAVKKINFLANKSIEHYLSFIDSLKDTKKELPDTFSDDVVRPTLVAYFCLGRLYSKIIVHEPPKEVEYLKKSEECYNFVVQYIEKNPQHETVIKEELAVMKEMAELIPSKIQSILGSTLY